MRMEIKNLYEILVVELKKMPGDSFTKMGSREKL
jgi:hypothetical protein